MADNSSLGSARKAKNDEFYTQYSDIEAEMNAYVEYDPDVFRGKTILLPCDDPEWSNFTKYFAANFERFGLKKLISTSYARGAGNRQMTLFELESPLFDESKHETHGKLFTLTYDKNGSGGIDTDVSSRATLRATAISALPRSLLYVTRRTSLSRTRRSACSVSSWRGLWRARSSS